MCASPPSGPLPLIDLRRALLMDVPFLLLYEHITCPHPNKNNTIPDSLVRPRAALGRGTLLAGSHAPFVSRLCDRLVVLDLGELIANGAPAGVLADAKVMSSYLGEAADA